MKYFVFDIEADSLDATHIHVLSYVELGKERVQSLTDYDEIEEFITQDDICLIGHSIILYDIPTLERLLKIKIKAKLIDTLALSWYLYDGRDSHGLESWGDEFGIVKPKIDDWRGLDIKEYINRCETDVKINETLWKKQASYLTTLYNNDDVYNLPIISYLSFKLDCIKEQCNSKFRIDKERILYNLDFLKQKKEDKETILRKVMPQVPCYATYKRPVRPFKKDGSLSSHGENGKARCESLGLTFEHKDDISIIIGWEVANPSSPIQQKDWLFSLGWEPRTFVYTKDKDGNTKAIPQIKKQFEPEFCDSVKELYEKEPNLEELEGLSIINSRISKLNAILECEVDGFVKQEIGGLTNTLRLKHKKPCENLPGKDRLYGELIREVFIARDGYELCGSDQAALENNTGDHYITFYDPEYVERKKVPGYDPHLEMCMVAGLMDQDDVDFYKAYKKTKEHSDEDKKRFTPLDKKRQSGKKTVYSGMYGIGKDKLSRELKCSVSEAKNLLDAYWKVNWAIRKAADDFEKKMVNGQLWVFNPVSKFYYSLRNEKDSWSTINQSTGVYAFDKWLWYIRKKRPQITAQWHDEALFEVKLGNRDKMEKLLLEAEDKVNEELKLNTTLSIDIKFGLKYKDVH